MIFRWFSYDFYRFPIVLLCFPLNMIWFGYDFRMVFCSFSLVFLWYSYGLPLGRLWFSDGFARYSDGIPIVFFYGFPMVLLGVPNVFLLFAKDLEAHGDWRKPYGGWRKDPEGQHDWRKPYGDWRKPDGYARERGTMESAAVGRGQVDPGPVLGPVSWYAAV